MSTVFPHIKKKEAKYILYINTRNYEGLRMVTKIGIRFFRSSYSFLFFFHSYFCNSIDVCLKEKITMFVFFRFESSSTSLLHKGTFLFCRLPFLILYVYIYHVG